MTPDYDSAGLDRLQKEWHENPESYETNLHLGLALAGTRVMQNQAEPYLMKALSFGKVNEHTKTLLRRLCWVKSTQANFDAAASISQAATDMFPNDPFLMLEYASALSVLGEMDRASKIQNEVVTALRQSARAFAQDEKQPLTVLLEPQVLIQRFVGEMAAKLDLYIKARALGLVDDAKAILCLVESRVVNLDFADYWRQYIDVVTNPVDVVQLARRYFNSWVLTDYAPLPDGRTLQRDYAYRVVQNLWEQENRPPLLVLKNEHRDKGAEVLVKYGMPKDAWFVCLHVRSGGFYREEQTESPNFHRNSDIATYLPAIEEIVDQGGWVVRLGDSSMPPLPKMPQVIDYAHMDYQFGWMDIFLIAACRFFIGTSSGPVSMAENFGTRILGTNWCSGGSWLACRGDIFIPKLYRRKITGEILTLEEMMKPPFYSAYQPQFFAKQGIEVVDNTAEEIRDGVIEMIEALEESVIYDQQDESLQRIFKKKADPYNLGLNSRVAKDFLRRYPELIKK